MHAYTYARIHKRMYAYTAQEHFVMHACLSFTHVHTDIPHAYICTHA